MTGEPTATTLAIGSRYARGLRWVLGAFALLGSVAGGFVVVRILCKSAFGTRLAFMANDTLLHGIGYCLLAALCWAALGWSRPRWRWLSALSLAAAIGIFSAYYFGIACTSKKQNTCEPLFSTWPSRPSLPWPSR